MKIAHLAAAACLAASSCLVPLASRAEPLQQQSFGIWKAEDICAREAFKKSPDYTPEGNRARELAYRQCIARGHLPPRSDASADQSKPDGVPGPAQR